MNTLHRQFLSAGALLLAIAAASPAQAGHPHVAVGISVGGPAYYQPYPHYYYPYPAYYSYPRAYYVVPEPVYAPQPVYVQGAPGYTVAPNGVQYTPAGSPIFPTTAAYPPGVIQPQDVSAPQNFIAPTSPDLANPPVELPPPSGYQSVRPLPPAPLP